MGTKLGLNALMLSVIDEFNHRTVEICQSKGKDVTKWVQENMERWEGIEEGQGLWGREVEMSGKSANIVEDEDRVWMAAVDDFSDADNEGKWAGCFKEGDDEDHYFSNDKS